MKLMEILVAVLWWHNLSVNLLKVHEIVIKFDVANFPVRYSFPTNDPCEAPDITYLKPKPIQAEANGTDTTLLFVTPGRSGGPPWIDGGTDTTTSQPCPSSIFTVIQIRHVDRYIVFTCTCNWPWNSSKMGDGALPRWSFDGVMVRPRGLAQVDDGLPARFNYNRRNEKRKRKTTTGNMSTVTHHKLDMLFVPRGGCDVIWYTVLFQNDVGVCGHWQVIRFQF